MQAPPRRYACYLDACYLAIIAASAACFMATVPAWASLGAARASVDVDVAHFKAHMKSTTTDNYTVQELTGDGGMVTREFTNGAGTVFAVSWDGPVRPDLQQLFGTYFPRFQADVVQANGRGRSHRAMRADDIDFIVRTGGHSGTCGALPCCRVTCRKAFRRMRCNDAVSPLGPFGYPLGRAPPFAPRGAVAVPASRRLRRRGWWWGWQFRGNGFEQFEFQQQFQFQQFVDADEYGRRRHRFGTGRADQRRGQCPLCHGHGLRHRHHDLPDDRSCPRRYRLDRTAHRARRAEQHDADRPVGHLPQDRRRPGR